LPPEEGEERKRVRETISRLQGAQQFVERAEHPPSPPTHPAPAVRHGVADAAFWTLASLSLGSLTAGGITGGRALYKRSQLDEFVLGMDGDLAERDQRAVQVDRLALSSDVLLGVGAVTAVTALLLFAVRTRPVRPAAESPSGRLQLRPALGSDHIGVMLGGRF
jgi:hypothetical protein